ncbi:hypothetical protein [Sinomicrobium weinanense]|uniref:Uncharacterized protein n=1 Tax=Sinomicrobium weinanense TaxID=2842200 RepID=A0A926JUC8_9FLAO|nr:hypothetical protein [Sinomicrobium weinanense]MBC9797536.1 hypothetical protein [Sinomicrobium weinanense]MBU3122395.1 hypothetical protein [Sinomicrobium weinanense]
MGRYFIYFWILFILYFIFAHPAIIYYNTASDAFLAQRDGKAALAYLALSVLMWGFILFVLLRLIYKNSFLAKKNIRDLMHEGVRMEAEIIEVKKLKPVHPSAERKALVLELQNLEGEKVWHKMEVNDTRPRQNRFVAGKHIFLRVDRKFKKRPYVVLDGTKSRINYKFFVLWLLFAAGLGWYYTYAYTTENKGYGWRFLSLDHPLISSAGMLLLFAGIFYLVIVKVIFKNVPVGKEALRLKFTGSRTMAKISDVSETGTYINNQPEVRFTVRFADKNGQEHKVVIKRIVPLTEIGRVNLKEKEIFYLPGEPHTIAFAQDVNSI